MPGTVNPSFLCPITQEIMTDPVIGSDGITYERSAIEAWFAQGHQTSPLTRQPMDRKLIVNYALKALIEEAQSGATTTTTTTGTSTSSDTHAQAPPPPITIKAGRLAGSDDNTYHISLSTPDTPGATIPTLFIDVLDISGSMGSSSVDTTHATCDAASFSRSDLVRHSVATQIELLRPQDKLALVLFDDKAQVALEPTSMNNIGRTRAKASLPSISPNGGTNIWQGLQKALKLAYEEVSGKHMNVVIILQTDGESDPSLNPPRGIVDTFKSWLDKHSDTQVTVHTVGYGFGSALDMPLLRQIAEAGRGTVNYVPDGSMIGTVFIHLMSNLMSCHYRNLKLQVPDAGVCEDVGFLQGGQSRDFIINITEPSFTIAVSDHTGVIASIDVDAVSCGDADPAQSTFEKVRLDLVKTLGSALASAEGGDIEGAKTCLQGLEKRASAVKDVDHRIVSLLTDLEHPEAHKGQIGKAFGNSNSFERWGRHYIPGVVCGHASQIPINFKDEGSKLYGGPTVKDLVIRGDDIFNSIPPPTPSCAYFSYSSSSSYTGGPAPAPISMASVNRASGPCFLGGSKVKVAGGMYKRCDQIRPGDMDDHGNRIRCVVKTLVNYVDIVRLGDHNPDGGFTLWHPVFINDKWHFPADVGKVQRVKATAVYNFVMETSHLLTIDGVATCTLGHDFMGPVVNHPYFGKRVGGQRNVIDDLSVSPGWNEGYVVWSEVRVERDVHSGLINRMTPASFPAAAVQ